MVKVSKEDATLLVDSEWDNAGPVAGLSFVATEYVESERWSETWLLIVKDETGQLWGAYFDKGATEYHELAPFEYDDVVEFHPAQEVQTVTYKLVK